MTGVSCGCSQNRSYYKYQSRVTNPERGVDVDALTSFKNVGLWIATIRFSLKTDLSNRVDIPDVVALLVKYSATKRSTVGLEGIVARISCLFMRL